jgi:ssDNA-binding Zn-finger/Zn-ribbon topoisomerase 1
MVERSYVGRGAFYGCTRFPICVGTRPIQPGQNSYTKLLLAAYDKALVFLSGPKFFGPAAAPLWLLSRALNLAEGDLPADSHKSVELTDGELERGIDAAIEHLATLSIDHDFLVAAHNDRMQAIRSRLQYSTAPTQLRNMPKAVIQRRYDAGTIVQFEASITTDWATDGQYCPRCGEWAESVHSKTKLDLLDAFDEEEDALAAKAFDCGECGIFTKNGNVYAYERDKNKPGVAAGITLGTTRQRPKD